MDPRLERIFELLPHRCDSIFIAGGAAVNYDLAGDVDLVFGGKNGFKLGKQFLETFAHFSRYELGSYASPNDLHMIGDAYDPMGDKIIQILWTKDKTASEAIAKFDISSHAAAWTSRGDYFVSDDAGTVAIRPAYINYNSLKRYIKICNRYGSPVDLSILEKLSSKVEVKAELDPPILGPMKLSDYAEKIYTGKWSPFAPMPAKTPKISNISWDWETVPTKDLPPKFNVVEDFSKQFAEYLLKLYPPPPNKKSE